METIRLSEAPERFFESSKWVSCVAEFGSRDRVLSWLNERDSGFIDYYAELNARDGHEPARRRLDAQKVVKGLVADLNARLTQGEVLASGFTETVVARVSIAPERWPALKLDFANCGVEGQIEFTEVLLWLPEPTGVELEAGCVTWLRGRQAEGAFLKKQLIGEALARFPEFKSREFDAAYKLVFQLARGRPRKSEPKK